MRKRLKEMAVGWTLKEASGGPVARVVLIKAGLSLNGVEYPPDVLAMAANKYEGRPCLLDHSWSPSVRDIAGWFRNVTWNRQEQQLEADLHLLDTVAGRTLLDLATEEAKLRDEGVLGDSEHLYGFSHVVFASTEEATDDEGRPVVQVTEIHEVLSVDAVVFPAAGGEQVDLRSEVEANKKETDATNSSTEAANTVQTNLTSEAAQCMTRTIQKVIAKESKLTERATRFRNLPLAERTRTWNGTTARRNLRRWASSDGSGDKDTIDWGVFRWGFFWYDDSDPQKFGSYKLPFADIIGGDIYAIPRGVFAAAGAVMGARGGADIPEGDIDSVKRHIASYYRKMREEWDDDSIVPPWQRESQNLTDEEASAFIEAFGLEAFNEQFGVKSDSGPDSTTDEPVEKEVNRVDEKIKETLEREIRERVAEEFAQKTAALVEENKKLTEQVESLTKQIEEFKHEKAEAERRAKLNELFEKYDIKGAAKETLEAIVEDMSIEKAEKVVALAASGTGENNTDPDVEKRTEETSHEDPVKIGEEFAKEILGQK